MKCRQPSQFGKFLVTKCGGTSSYNMPPVLYNIGNMQKVRTFVLKLGSVVTTVRKIGEFRFLTANNLETHIICT
jgi:hypothetical protein